MDQHGIGAALLAGLNIYQSATRQTGRTNKLVESIDERTTILTHSEREANRLTWLLEERRNRTGKSFVAPRVHRQETLHTTRLRMVYDHALVEQLYQRAINDVADEIAYFETKHTPIEPLADVEGQIWGKFTARRSTG
jgi:HD-GYP domain-containing protein (c-di-GMP phosphodiesterase class II)